MLPDDVKDEVRTLVHVCADTRDRLITIFAEEMYEPGELDMDLVTAEIDVQISALEREAQTWPLVTDFDRLTSAFTALTQLGVLCFMDAGNTQSDGYDDFRDALARHARPSEVIGYCFYHGQDAERAVRGGGLFLAFGPSDAKNEDTEGARIGELVCAELRRAGLTPEWNGTFAKRIHIPKFPWQRRPCY